MRLRPGSKALIRDINTNLVLDVIRRYGPCARAEIVERTRLSRSTVTEILAGLDQEGLLATSGKAGSSGGRRAELIRLEPLARLSAGFALGGGRLLGVLLDLYGQPVARLSRSLCPDLTALGLAEALRSGLYPLLEQVGACPDRLTGCGLALSGQIDPREGMVLDAPQLGWQHLPLETLLGEILGLPVSLASSAQALALAERRHGPYPGAESLLALWLDESVSVAVIADGRLILGRSGGGGDLSHWPAHTGSRRCTCGRRGCLRTVAAEPAVREAPTEGAEALGHALAGLAAALSPEAIIVGGPLPASAGPLLLDPLRHAIRSHSPPGLEPLPVLAGRLGEEAPAVGAALAVQERFFQPPVYESPW
ncbi:MAG: ROK family transcriptional regulator [Bacillota bacterium]